MSAKESLTRISLGVAAGATVIGLTAAVHQVEVPPQAIAATGGAVIGAAAAAIANGGSRRD